MFWKIQDDDCFISVFFKNIFWTQPIRDEKILDTVENIDCFP